MQIDSCGSNSGQLKHIYRTIIKKKSAEKEGASINYARQLDDELYQSYQHILSIATDGNSVAAALYNLSKQVESGAVSLEDLSSIAYNAAMEAITEEKIIVDQSVAQENMGVNLAIIAIAGGKLNQNEQQSVDILCTDEIEESYKDIYENAKTGDSKAQKVKDLINRAESYVINRDELNPKGAISGALALIYQLKSTNDPTAIAVARKMISTFGLEEVFENGDINIARVQALFDQKNPNKDLTGAIQRHDIYVAQNKERIVQRGTASNKENVIEIIEEKRVLELSRKVQALIREGREGDIEQLIKGCKDLAQKVYAQDNSFNHPNHIVTARIKALGDALEIDDKER